MCACTATLTSRVLYPPRIYTYFTYMRTCTYAEGKNSFNSFHRKGSTCIIVCVLLTTFKNDGTDY